MSLGDTYAALTGSHDSEKSLLFSKYFKEKADQVMVENTVLYDGVKETLESLRAGGMKIGIVTTKFHYRIEQILSKFGALELVDLIVGAEDVKLEKPDPEGLLWAIEHIGACKENILYVGDSLVDAKTAQNAKVRFAAVLTGTTTREEFEKYPHMVITENVSCLHGFILGL